MMRKEVIEKLGIELTPMQEAATDAILHTDKDVVILSPTGSGKTLAYLLPLIERLDAAVNEVQAVVIVPGRELALQSSTVLKELGSGLRTMACYGGHTAMEEHRKLRQVRPQIIFGTPGRLNDHIDKGNIPINDVKWLVIDEFDKCLEMGFADEMSALLSKLPQVRRRVLLSATETEAIPRFVNMGRTLRIDYRTADEQVPERVQIYQVISLQKDKLETLRQLLLNVGNQKSVVFLNYRDSVERTADYLRKQGFYISSFHGGMEQKQREDALSQFSNGSAHIFVSTDLASRGLDIPDIDNIIHYHLPETEENYVHRVGRTARWDKQGRAFFILNEQETLPDYVKEECPIFSLQSSVQEIPVPKMVTLYIGKGKKDKLSRGDIVGFLCKKGGLTGEEIGKIRIEERFTYVAIARPKLQQVLRQVRGEKIKGVRTVFEEVR